MKFRSDSPFAVLTELDLVLLRDVVEGSTIEQVVEHMEREFPDMIFSVPALKRLLRRLREEDLAEEMEEGQEALEVMAKSGREGRARDGMIEAMRRRMYAQGLEAKTPEQVGTVYNMMKAEAVEDRRLKMEERRLALEEENARQEWRARELEASSSALKLLPRIRELLCEETEGTVEERMGKARELLMVGGAALLTERVARTED